METSKLSSSTSVATRQLVVYFRLVDSCVLICNTNEPEVAGAAYARTKHLEIRPAFAVVYQVQHNCLTIWHPSLSCTVLHCAQLLAGS